MVYWRVIDRHYLRNNYILCYALSRNFCWCYYCNRRAERVTASAYSSAIRGDDSSPDWQSDISRLFLWRRDCVSELSGHCVYVSWTCFPDLLAVSRVSAILSTRIIVNATPVIVRRSSYGLRRYASFSVCKMSRNTATVIIATYWTVDRRPA